MILTKEVLKIPIPQPKKGEDKDAFISRCMGDSVMNREFPDQDQRYKVCEAQFSEEEMEEVKKSIWD